MRSIAAILALLAVLVNLSGLVYLSQAAAPTTPDITATPTERSVRFVTTRTQAVWKAVEKACVTGDFRPRQSLLCNSCAFQPWCPAFGGDPQLAASEAPVRFGYAA